jgi:hypothetical protein
MSPEPGPSGEQDGQQPSDPRVPGDGQPEDGVTGRARDAGGAWDGDAELARLIAEVDAGLVQIPDETDSIPAVWYSLAGSSDPEDLDLAGLAQGGRLNTRPPDATLAALAEMACDPAVLSALSDNQVLGLAAAGRRLAGRAAWIQHAAVAEFAARRAEQDPRKATPYGFTAFAPDELVPELVITTSAAELTMAQARDAARRLPASCARLGDGLISAYQLKIITEATQCLDDAGAAEADKLLAAAAPGLTPSQLRAMCTRVVLMIDPQAAQQRKDSAAKDARVIRFQEYSGNAALCGRDLPPDEVLASSQHIDGRARALRAAGIPGTLEQLRALCFLDLTQGRDPLDRLAAPPDDQYGGGHGPGGAEDPRPGGPSASGGAGQPSPSGSPPDSPPGTPPDSPSGSPPGSQHGSPPGSSRAPVKATITLLVPAGTLLGWSSAPGEIPGFGLLDPQTTRDMTAAAAAHPQTRWCVTVVGPDGTAAAHGCAPGRHPWTPSPRDGPGPDPPHRGASPTAEQAAQIIGLLSRLRVKFAPIAKGTCDHRHYSDRYVISRKVKDLIKARTTKCIAPCCNRPAADADADHTIPWPIGPSCECNIGPPCRYHHRNKQAPGWRLEQPQPGVMRWHTPSGRTHTTYPTKYVI